MTLRYTSEENPTKTQTRPDWKVNLVKSWFDQNKISKHNVQEAREMLLRWGWTLQTKPIGKTATGNRFEVAALDTQGRAILSFQTDDTADVL